MMPVAMPVLEKAEAEAAHEAVLSGWVSQAPQVAAFEREWKRCLAHGRDRFELLVGAAALGNNLMRIADLLVKQKQSSRRRKVT